MRPTISFAGLAILCLAHAAVAQEAAPPSNPPSLASVTWAGPIPSPSAFKGKTVLVITYVTWCPKCNAWSGDMAAQVKSIVADKPVIVLAVSTDTPPAQAAQYMQSRGLVGPNIFHGHDPTIAQRFGFDNKFFNYAVIDPEGKITLRGDAGGQFTDGKQPSYAVARKLAEIPEPGTFRFLKPEMSAALKERLWLVELGASKSLNRDLKKMEKGLATDDRDLLRSTVQEFVAEEVKSLDELSKSADLNDKLAAIDKATFLNTQFGSTAEGRRAKEILSEFAKDKSLKREALAKRQYETSMKIADEDKRSKALELLGERFADTQFGKRASEAAQAIAR
jgi:hypothetical protein